MSFLQSVSYNDELDYQPTMDLQHLKNDKLR